MGKKQDFGYMIYTNGSKYEGSWVNDMREGKGTFLMNNGQKYKGEWYRDVIHGIGKLLEIAEDKPQLYIGRFSKGKKRPTLKLNHPSTNIGCIITLIIIRPKSYTTINYHYGLCHTNPLYTLLQ